jgi:hypothetical protein
VRGAREKWLKGDVKRRKAAHSKGYGAELEWGLRGCGLGTVWGHTSGVSSGESTNSHGFEVEFGAGDRGGRGEADRMIASE